MFNKEKSVSVNIHFSTSQIFKFLVILLLIFLSIRLYRVFILLFISFILMASTKPAAYYLNRKLRIPLIVGLFLTYILVLFVFVFAIYFISRPLGAEIRHLSDNSDSLVNDFFSKVPILKDKVDETSASTAVRNYFSTVSTEFSKVGNAIGNALNITVSAFNVLLEVLSILIISIYLFVERDVILRFIILVFGLDREKFLETYDKIETQLGAWVRGQILLGVIVGSMTWVGLAILQVKFALPLAVLAGVFEVIPIIGPILSAIPITLVGFTINPLKGLATLLLSFLVQQIENNFLVPVVMKKAVGLSPVVTLISILIGSKLLGLIGAIISVPLAATLSVILLSYLNNKIPNFSKELRDGDRN